MRYKRHGETFVFVMEFVNILVSLFESKSLAIKYIKNLDIRNVNQKLSDDTFSITITSLNYILFKAVIESYYTKNNKLTRPYTVENENVLIKTEFGEINFRPECGYIKLETNEKNLELFKVLMLEILNNIYGKVDKK